MDAVWYWIGQPHEILIGIVVIGLIVFYEVKKSQRQKLNNKKEVEKYVEGVSKKTAERRKGLLEKSRKPKAADGDEYIVFDKDVGDDYVLDIDELDMDTGEVDIETSSYELDIDEEDL